MLGILFTTNNGSSLVFIAGFFLLPVLISLISITAKLIFFSKRKYYLVRPLLTVVIFILIFTIAHWLYDVALEHAIREAELIHKECNENLYCPKIPPGWIVNGNSISKRDLGTWYTYTASYYYNIESFNIRVYQGPDLGDHITGGIDTPLEVIPYVDG